MALRLKDALLHKNGASESGRAAYGVQFRVCLNLEVEEETESKVLCAEVKTACVVLAHLLCSVVGTLITEETEVSDNAETVGKVEGNTGTETNFPCACSVAVIAVNIHVPDTGAEAYRTVNEELNEVVARTEIRPTCIGVEVEEVVAGLCAAVVLVLITDAKTYSPLAVEVVTNLRLNVESVGRCSDSLVVEKADAAVTVVPDAEVAAYVPVFCVYTEGRCDSHHCESKNFLHNFLLFLGNRGMRFPACVVCLSVMRGETLRFLQSRS